jgi:hypothetical protein
VLEPEDLTLDDIDALRHLYVNELLIKAVALAVRSGHTDRTAYRFATLMMTNLVDYSHRWTDVLKTITELEAEEN